MRWVSPEKIHLTLKFFGNIEESRIEPIVKSIEGPIQTTPPFPSGSRDGCLSPFEKPEGDLDGIGGRKGKRHFLTEAVRGLIGEDWI